MDLLLELRKLDEVKYYNLSNTYTDKSLKKVNLICLNIFEITMNLDIKYKYTYSMNLSQIIATPTKSQIIMTRYENPNIPFGNKEAPGTIKPLYLIIIFR